MKSYIAGIILIFSAVIIEASILSNITILPAVPDLALVCLLYMSVRNGRTQGQILGFLLGLFIDLMTGIPLGFNCIIRTVIGYIAGTIGVSLNTSGLIIPAVFAFLATLFKAFAAWIISMLFPSMINTVNISSVYFLFSLIVNTIITPALFKFFSLFSALFEYEKDGGV